MDKIGVIGLGAMGGGVTGNLLKKGGSVYIYDLQSEKTLQYAEQGAIAMASCGELARNAQIVMLFLPMAPFDPTLKEVVTDVDGLLENMQKGGLIVDCGNTSPQLVRELAALAKAKGIGFVDAPASGGAEGAQQGTLSVMAGGEEEDYRRLNEVLTSISSESCYFGGPGAGQTAKLINNMLVNGQLALLSEVLVFAEKTGLDLRALVETMSKGAAASWVLDIYGNGILDRPYKGYATPGGGFSGKDREGGRDKQLACALAMAEEMETPLPMTSIAYQQFMMARGMGKKGLFEPVLDMLEDVAKVEVLGHKP